MSASRRALATHLHQQASMRLGDRDVVRDHRDGLEDVFDERRSAGSRLATCEKGADAQLGDRDGGDGNVIVIGDRLVQAIAAPVGIDEERRVEEQPGQDRSSISSNRRVDERSSAQLGSRRWRCSTAFTSMPSPGLAGSSRATARPRRTTVKCSPRCSTASRRSANLRAASVALTSVTLIRLSETDDVAGVLQGSGLTRLAGSYPYTSAPVEFHEDRLGEFDEPAGLALGGAGVHPPRRGHPPFLERRDHRQHGRPGQNPRGAVEMDPLWLLLDTVPEGRGIDWQPQLTY